MSDTVTNGVVRDRMLSLKGIMAVSLAVTISVTTFPARASVAMSLSGQAERTDSVPIDPEALEALYSLDFDVARAKFQELVDQHPENPRLWNLLASSVWLKIVYEQQKLNLDSYMGNRLGGNSSNDRVSPEVEAQLREYLGKAIELSEAALENDAENVEALYAKGTAYGTLASFEATVKRAYLAANSAAKKAREAHLKVLRIDPSYNDARLTIGTYDYALGVIPGVVRFLLGFLGIWGGDKDGGIQELEYAARLGNSNQTNAKMVLVVIYNRERQYEKSIELLEDLHSRYPRNFLLETTKANVYERLEMWDEAVETYETVLGKVETGENDYDRLEWEPLVFKIGEVDMKRAEWDSAKETFESLLESDNDEVAGRAHLWIGKIYDIRGERRLAIAEYDSVLALNASDNIRDEARALRRRPYGESD
jgi:tetratricopeptide (TPR) repeat protein